MTFNKETYLNNLKQTIESYYPISEKSWKLIENITDFHTLKKGEALLRNGEIAKYEVRIGLSFLRITFDIFRNNQAILLN